MQQRYYDPTCGCFLSVDPVTAYQKPLTNFGRYVYANNNPYKFTDPDGRMADLEHGWKGDYYRDQSGEKHDCEFCLGEKVQQEAKPKEIRNSSGELDALKKGDVEGYYSSRILRGDGYAVLALDVVKNRGLLGRLANWWLGENIGAVQIRLKDSHAITGDLSDGQFRRLVNVDLARAHGAAVDSDNLGVRGLLSPSQISQYHENYFRSLGLPASTFGGSAWGMRTTYWCNSCDH